MKKYLLLIIIIFLSGSLFAQVPKTLNFQGVLTNASDIPQSPGPFTFTFSIYDVPTGGSALWTEIHSLTTDINGLYNAVLGASAGTAVPINLAFDKPYYLEIDVDGSTMTSRVILTTPAYTLNDNLEDLADGELSDSKLEPNLDRTNLGASNNIAAGNYITALGGVHVGGLSDPGTDNLIVDGNATISGNLNTTGTTTLGGTTGVWRVNATDYINASGGMHVGGTSDPGTDNLVVDGTSTLTGDVTTTGTFKYSSPEIRYVNINHASFNIAYQDLSAVRAYRNVSGSGSPYMLRTQGGAIANKVYFLAPVNLPDGAVVTEMFAKLYDANATYDVEVQLRRQGYSQSSSPNYMAQIITSGSSGQINITTPTISDPIIDNQGYAYYLMFVTQEATTQMGMYNIRLKYTLTNAGQ